MRPVRKNTGNGVNILEPTLSGETHDNIKKQVQFLMEDQENNNEASIKYSTRVMC